MKKMFSYSLLFFVVLVISSCTKTAPVVIDNSPRTQLLTNHNWVMYEYFTHFNEPAASLVWKMNRDRNSRDFAEYQIKFNNNLTYTEVAVDGNTGSGTWSYSDDGTQILTKNRYGTTAFTIAVLNANRYEGMDNEGNYGILIPDTEETTTTGSDLTYMLTARPWRFDEYFSRYDLYDAVLDYKFNKPQNSMNWLPNILTFNDDGSYSEANAAGVTKGSWSFLNNGSQLKIVAGNGTLICSIKLLSNDRFEWLSIDGVRYAELVH